MSSPDWLPTCQPQILRKRAQMLATIRDYFYAQDILEVETPCLCHTAGTDPNLDLFVTHLHFAGNNKQRPLTLQTSPEFSMKRLLASGSGSIYQICKAFRNGESGRYHNPEFTLLEWYRVGFNLQQLMDDIENLLCTTLKRIIPPGKSQRVSYHDIFMKHCGFSPLTSDIDVFSEYAVGKGFTEAPAICGQDLSLWQDFLFCHQIQPKIGHTRLTFIFDYPANQASLARINPNQPEVAERVEVFFQGVELANGFHELADPVEQERRFDQELEQRRKSNHFTPQKDRRLLAALKAGLPDCSGVAVGLDRLLMLSISANSIEEVLSFPVDRA